MIIYSPLNEVGLRNILYTAQLGLNHPIAIRYPRGRGVIVDWEQPYQKIDIGKATELRHGKKIAVLSNGFIGNNVIQALSEIHNHGDFAHFDFAFVKPLDANLLHDILNRFEHIITVEDGTVKGGFGSAIVEFSAKHGYRPSIKVLGIPDEFIEQGTIAELQHLCKIDVESLKVIFSEY